MRIEVRRSGGHACTECGSYDLIHAGPSPLAADLAPVMEREMIRRELRLFRLYRSHLETVAQERVDHEARIAAEFVEQTKSERNELEREKQEQVAVIEALLSESKQDVPAWRLARKRREKKFAERIDNVIAELKQSTVNAT